MFLCKIPSWKELEKQPIKFSSQGDSDCSSRKNVLNIMSFTLTNVMGHPFPGPLTVISLLLSMIKFPEYFNFNPKTCWIWKPWFLFRCSNFFRYQSFRAYKSKWPVQTETIFQLRACQEYFALPWITQSLMFLAALGYCTCILVHALYKRQRVSGMDVYMKKKTLKT